jgi:hypothetical protein
MTKLLDASQRKRRLTAIKICVCTICGDEFETHSIRALYCPDCKLTISPIVYRFIAPVPDGRSYVGSMCDGRTRANDGVARSNSRLEEAFAQYPPEMWTYEVLEQLPQGCSRQELVEAEQRHIDRLQTYLPEFGFNMKPAVGIIPRYQCETVIRDAARARGLKPDTVRSRMRRGLPLEQALTSGVLNSRFSAEQLQKIITSGVHYMAVWRRVINGMQFEQAIEQAIIKKNTIKIAPIAREHGLNPDTVRHRIKQGLPLEQALTPVTVVTQQHFSRFSVEQLEKIKASGIPYATIRKRVAEQGYRSNWLLYQQTPR